MNVVGRSTLPIAVVAGHGVETVLSSMPDMPG